MSKKRISYIEESEKLQHHFEELEKRLQNVEEKVDVLTNLVEPNKYPFQFLVLHNNLTKAQVSAIYELMLKVQKTFRTKKPMSHHAFEQIIYKIVPAKIDDYSFVANIVHTLHTEKPLEYEEIYKHFKKDGMNI